MSKTPRVDLERLAATIDAACCQDKHRSASGYYANGNAIMGAQAYHSGPNSSTGGHYIVHLGAAFAMEDRVLWAIDDLPAYAVEHLLKLNWTPNDPVPPLVALARSADDTRR